MQSLLVWEEVKKRDILRRGRKVLGFIPGAMYMYGVYWKIRFYLETKINKSQSTEIIDIFREGKTASFDHLTTQLCSGEQMRHHNYAKWCWRMYSPPRFSRKQWEFAYILEAIYQRGKLKPGQRALGFGCGLEPIPAILAQFGVDVLATDLRPEEAQSKGWVNTYQNTGTLVQLQQHSRWIIDKDAFFHHVSHRHVDMNSIPTDLTGFDIVWSACALEHLGSLEAGLNFIINSCACLSVGGVAVHTTEFNLSSNDNTTDERDCCIYRMQDILRLADMLLEKGFALAEPNFNMGRMGVDEYIDLPPFRMSPHLKLKLGNYAVTSIGLIIQRLY